MEDDLFKKRLTELADKAYNNSQYVFTGFLSMAEADIYYKMERELSYAQATLFGGTKDCERVMIRFGSEDICGYVEEFPIECIEIEPLIEKFAQQLTHRDYLGALMNLGIERSTIGDIIVDGKRAFIFCTDKMADYIVENVDKINHTSVRCKKAQNIPESTITRLERKRVQVSQVRADSIISKVYGMSRSESVNLFRTGKVYINGRLNENNSGQLKAEDKVSVRGFGRFNFVGIAGESKKGKLNVDIDIPI